MTPTPALSPRRKLAVMFSVFSLAVALCEALQEPIRVRPDGAWESLFGPLWDHFGSAGLVGFWLVLGTAFAAVGLGWYQRCAVGAKASAASRSVWLSTQAAQ